MVLSVDTSVAPPSSQLTLETTLPSQVNLSGTYVLKLKVSYASLPSISAEREFVVELIDPCPTATFTIDASDSVFLALGTDTIH